MTNAFDDMGEWGYCRWCKKLQLLTEEGALPVHASSTLTASSVCPGSTYEPTEPPPEREHYGPEPFAPDPVHPKGDGDNEG